jgi:hypothetical protein
MKNLSFIAVSLLALAACAPQPQSGSSLVSINAARAFVATEAARHCPNHLALNRGVAYDNAMAYSNAVMGGRAASFRQETAERMSQPGYCERVRNNLLVNPNANAFLRAK